MKTPRAAALAVPLCAALLLASGTMALAADEEPPVAPATFRATSSTTTKATATTVKPPTTTKATTTAKPSTTTTIKPTTTAKPTTTTNPSTTTTTTANTKVSLHRFFNTKTLTHFYTASEAEKQAVLAKYKQYTYEGTVGQVWSKTTNPGKSEVVVYRFYNKAKNTHFYTSSEAERDQIRKSYKEWTYEGPAFTAWSKQVSGTAKLYRFYSSQRGAHFYTAAPEEAQTVRATLKDYSYEGVAYYIDDGGLAASKPQASVSGVKLSGNGREGQTLTVTVGSITPAGAKPTYAWFCGDVVMAGSGTTHTVTSGDFGCALSVRVTVAPAGYWLGMASSNAITIASPFRPVDPPTVYYSGHWVDVDLSAQVVTLFDGTTPVKRILVSTGKPSTPTRIGTFKVYAKVRKQWMGDTPNVTWVAYFDGGIATHTAWWHNNFGQVMSHGCVNMREADAKFTYDWVKIGTVVVVHA
jgi:hypothetical protein